MHDTGTSPRPTVELHLFDLQIDGDTYARYRSYLHTSEIERADRFMFDHLRRHFVAAHGALRCILAQALHIEPQEVNFGRGAQGKPFLLGTDALDFNLSHSGERALIALHRRRDRREVPLGIDIEALRPGTDFAGISRRFLAPSEREQLPESDAPDFAASFLQIWTRKEAVTKCLGTGLHTPLTSFATTDKSFVSWQKSDRSDDDDSDGACPGSVNSKSAPPALYVQNVTLSDTYIAALCTPEPVELHYCWSRNASSSASFN